MNIHESYLSYEIFKQNFIPIAQNKEVIGAYKETYNSLDIFMITNWLLEDFSYYDNIDLTDFTIRLTKESNDKFTVSYMFFAEDDYKIKVTGNKLSISEVSTMILNNIYDIEDIPLERKAVINGYINNFLDKTIN